MSVLLNKMSSHLYFVCSNSYQTSTVTSSRERSIGLKCRQLPWASLIIHNNSKCCQGYYSFHTTVTVSLFFYTRESTDSTTLINPLIKTRVAIATSKSLLQKLCLMEIYGTAGIDYGWCDCSDKNGYWWRVKHWGITVFMQVTVSCHYSYIQFFFVLECKYLLKNTDCNLPPDNLAKNCNTFNEDIIFNRYIWMAAILRLDKDCGYVTKVDVFGQSLDI